MRFPELRVHEHPLPYSGKLGSRATSDITLVVIHCTELPDLAMAREYGEAIRYPVSGTGNSGHYYIDRDGRVEEWVPVDRIAHHVRDHNNRSIGIELVNRGRYPNWLQSNSQEMTECYPPGQIDALIELLHLLASRLTSLRWITGHERLDVEQVPATDNPDVLVFRKRDPGPLFPWIQLLNDVPLQSLPEGATIR
jgi:N-acetylmuramoyl-L-alanine amidase